MDFPLTRRGWMALTPGLLAAQPLTVSETFPRQPSPMVQELVGVSHRDPKRVKELLQAHPALANACWDWGFGDWETGLGAASHVGNREIAELHLAHGAHPTLFSAAMLGELDTVKAFLAARPALLHTRGPHGISLLLHARAGGAASKPVVAYLDTLGESPEPAIPPVSEADLERLRGSYGFGNGANDTIEISRKGKQLSFQRKGGDVRMIHHVGDLAFRPAGASAVRIRFSTAGEDLVLTVHDPEPICVARRTTK